MQVYKKLFWRKKDMYDRCALCGKPFQYNEEKCDALGMLPAGQCVCRACREDIRSLTDFAASYNEQAYTAVRQSFFIKHNSDTGAMLIRSSDSIHSQFSQSSGGLYSNPGRTLKVLAKVFFFLFAAIGIVSGIVLGSTPARYHGEFNFWLFLLPSATGVIVGYFGGLSLAAFGDLVSNAKEIKDLLTSRLK